MYNPCPVVVITGGPAAGKTTVIEHLSAMPGVLVVPEVFSLAPAMMRRMSTPVRQRYIYRTHVRLLEEACARAEKDGARLILCDRGTLDGLGYIDEEDFCALTGVPHPADEYARYDAIVYLESVAYCSEAIYNALVDERRAESYGTALTLSDRQRAAWEGHPQFFPIAADADFDRKVDAAVQLILEVLHGRVD